MCPSTCFLRETDRAYLLLNHFTDYFPLPTAAPNLPQRNPNFTRLCSKLIINHVPSTCFLRETLTGRISYTKLGDCIVYFLLRNGSNLFPISHSRAKNTKVRNFTRLDTKVCNITKSLLFTRHLNNCYTHAHIHVLVLIRACFQN